MALLYGRAGYVTATNGGVRPGKMSGYLSNMLDLAPRHAGALMGISNTVATLPGVFSPEHF